MKPVIALLLLGTVACDHPDDKLLYECRSMCSPRLVRSFTWDGFQHAVKCECEQMIEAGVGQ